jgi:hypothetical protein
MCVRLELLPGRKHLCYDLPFYESNDVFQRTKSVGRLLFNLLYLYCKSTTYNKFVRRVLSSSAQVPLRSYVQCTIIDVNVVFSSTDVFTLQIVARANSTNFAARTAKSSRNVASAGWPLAYFRSDLADHSFLC